MREVRTYKAPDLRKDSLDLTSRRRTTPGIGADQQRVAARGPGHGDVAEAVLPLLPVLSPTRQSLGRPARNRLSPVLQPSIQPVRRSREFGDKTFPRIKCRRVPAIAAGVVVSCGSEGGERFNSGSL